VAALLLLLWACSLPEPSWPERWDADPDAALAALAAEPDPILQVAAFRALVDHDPGVAQRCDALAGARELAEECRLVAGRPHLWETSTRTRRSLPLEGVVSPWGERSHACLEEAPSRWRRECFFRAAEAAFSSGRPGEAAALCLGVEANGDRCLGHLARLTATSVPGTLGDWLVVADTVASVGAALPASLGDRAMDRMWAESTLQSVWQAEQASGGIAVWLPDRAHRHLRAAVAWRVVSERPEAAFEELVEATTAAMGADPSGPSRARAPHGAVPYPAVQATDPWVAYLRDQRRAVSEDVDEDLRLCVVEAAARQGRVEALAEAATGNDPAAERARALARRPGR